MRVYLPLAMVMPGYTVLAARDAEEALRISSEHDEPVELLLTDLIMSGLSGAASAPAGHRRAVHVGV